MRRLAAGIAGLGLALTAGADGVPAGMRDPTRPPLAQSHAAVPQEPAPVLSAVLTFEGKRTAIFNGRLVHAGSVVGPYTIESVLTDGVRYRRASQTHELRLANTGSTMKKPAAEAPPAPSGVQ